MTTKSIIMWAGIFLAVVGSIVGLYFLSTIPVASKKVDITLVADDHIRTGKGAKVVLVEYSDFQCPACRAYYPLVKQLEADYGDSLEVVYRHFPLSQHQYAHKAAYAAESAAQQGKFFEMHDMLFEGQTDWEQSSDPASIFVSYAEKLGLNIEQFKKDMNDPQIAARVERDAQEGDKLNIQGTPTFFLNGVMLNNPQSYPAFKALIDDARKNS